MKSLESRFRCGVTRTDLRTSPESSADAVNGWLSHATGGRLAGLLRPDAIDPSSKMMLASAFYFRASAPSVLRSSLARTAEHVTGHPGQSDVGRASPDVPHVDACLVASRGLGLA